MAGLKGGTDATGLAKSKCDTGDKGDAGETGSKGDKRETGATKQKGDTRLKGDIGDIGLAGAMGGTGTTGINTNIKGSYNTYRELINAYPTGNTDSYLVNGSLYVWNGNT